MADLAKMPHFAGGGHQQVRAKSVGVNAMLLSSVQVAARKKWRLS